MLSVQKNLSAMNANRQLNVTVKRNKKTSEKLSSGYRINRAADDAAGLTISEKMRRQIRGLTQASLNAEDGISFVQIADGALVEVHDMLQRSNELAIQAANGTLTDADREAIDKEVQAIKSEINGIAQRTQFNELKVFPEDGRSPRDRKSLSTKHYDVLLNLTDGSVEVRTDGASGARSGNAATPGELLADKIANELVPNAVSQIFSAFPSLQAATGSDTMEIALDISYLDGPGNTLAYAQFSYYSSGGRPLTLLLKVDSTDFSDADAAGTGSGAEKLESTIAHEIMHTIMQYNLTDGMTGRTGEEFPTWFKEGTAQLAGGGFPTHWNDTLKNYANQMSGDTDTSRDAAISNYLQRYTMNARPYGHGYLGAAYLGYLANRTNGGGTAVTGANIAAGIDRIFGDMITNHKNFTQAVRDNIGDSAWTESTLEGLFAGGDAGLVEFVRKLSYASRSGAGSVIATSLGVGGTNILGDTAGQQAFWMDFTKAKVDMLSRPDLMNLQIGAEAEHQMNVQLYQINTMELGLTDLSVKTLIKARDSLSMINDAIGYVSGVRSYYGAVQNRLEHTIANLDNVVENTTAAESRIRDTDMAESMMVFAKDQILQQAGQAMLAQANQQPQMLLSLLSR